MVTGQNDVRKRKLTMSVQVALQRSLAVKKIGKKRWAAWGVQLWRLPEMGSQKWTHSERS